MQLTQKQEDFCLTYIETGNASEAYRRSYSASKMSESTINRAAKTVMDNSKITARLSELRAPVREAAQISLESHLNALKGLRDRADSADNFGAAITAEVARGKASGLYTDKIKVEMPKAPQIIINVPSGGA